MILEQIPTVRDINVGVFWIPMLVMAILIVLSRRWVLSLSLTLTACVYAIVLAYFLPPAKSMANAENNTPRRASRAIVMDDLDDPSDPFAQNSKTPPGVPLAPSLEQFEAQELPPSPAEPRLTVPRSGNPTSPVISEPNVKSGLSLTQGISFRLPAPAPRNWHDEFKNRLAGAGAKTGKIQVSMIYFTKDDLDIHVILPDGRRIYYKTPKVDGGELDVDRNRSDNDLTDEPVENIVFVDNPPTGTYRVYVDFYNHRPNQGGTNPAICLVRVIVDGKMHPLYTCNVPYDPNRGDTDPEAHIVDFVYPPPANGRP